MIFANVLFIFGLLIDLSLVALAMVLVRRSEFRSIGCWLLGYVLTALYSDYAVAIVRIDRALGRGGSLFHQLALSRDVNFVVASLGKVALLIAIVLFLVRFVKARANTPGSVSR